MSKLLDQPLRCQVDEQHKSHGQVLVEQDEDTCEQSAHKVTTWETKSIN